MTQPSDKRKAAARVRVFEHIRQGAEHTSGEFGERVRAGVGAFSINVRTISNAVDFDEIDVLRALVELHDRNQLNLTICHRSLLFDCRMRSAS